MEFYSELFSRLRQVAISILPLAVTESRWRYTLIRITILWIFVSTAWPILLDGWYNLNFNEPWSSSDYPELHTAYNRTSLVPWMMQEYRTMRRSNIRLLHVHPSSSLWRIEATLESVSFLDRPSYRALSYTWGSSSRPMTITVNGKKMSITRNLWEALFNIRDRNKNETIWVDAICIDQASNEEKSVHVPLVSFIYGRAKEVIVWLGDHSPPHWFKASSPSLWRGDWAVSKAKLYWPATKYWLYVLANQDYWHRCWIVQEIATASTIRVFSGKYSIPWPELMKLMRLYKSKEHLYIDAVDSVLKLQAVREAKYLDGATYTLSNLLENFSDCFSTLPVDKIFAFVGMASDCQTGCISADYKINPLSIYRELISFWNRRCLITGQDSAEIVHSAALVRSILVRKSVSVPKSLVPPEIGADTTSWVYQACGDERKEYCGLIPKLPTLLVWVDLARNIYATVLSVLLPQDKTGTTENWLPQAPESTSLWLPDSNSDSHSTRDMIQIRGATTGIICSLGPTYQEYIERPQVPRRWANRLNNLWGLVCNETRMRIARTINERLASLLGSAADHRMQNFVSLNDSSPHAFYSSRLFLAFDAQNEVLLGLAPRDALIGDALIQFWNTNTVLVVRERKHWHSPALIGRAGIVKTGNGIDWDSPTDKTIFQSAGNTRVSNYMVDIQTLTRLSFDTVWLAGARSSYDEELHEQPTNQWISQSFHGEEHTSMESTELFDSMCGSDTDSGIQEIELTADNFQSLCSTMPCGLVQQGHILVPQAFTESVEDSFRFSLRPTVEQQLPWRLIPGLGSRPSG